MRGVFAKMLMALVYLGFTVIALSWVFEALWGPAQ